MHWISLAIVALMFFIRWVWPKYYKQTYPWQWKKYGGSHKVGMHADQGIFVQGDQNASWFPLFWNQVVVIDFSPGKIREFIDEVIFTIKEGDTEMSYVHKALGYYDKTKLAFLIGPGDVTFFAISVNEEKLALNAEMMTKKQAREKNILII